MSDADRIKWQQRYAQGNYQKGNPVKLLHEWVPRIATGRALDLACGAGRNSIYLAQAGFQVDAIDISSIGLRDASRKADALDLRINWILHDLDQAFEFDQNYALIVVMWYVNLNLIEQLCGCLAAGGYLICEEHLLTSETVIGPTSRNFRVAPGALREATRSLEHLYYRESVEDCESDQRVASARVVARNS